MSKKDNDINNLSQRIRRFKASRKEQQRETATEDNAYSRSAAGWQISVELLSGVMIGAGIGYIADSAFNTAPWLLVLMTIFGGAAGILTVYRTFHDEEKNTKE